MFENRNEKEKSYCWECAAEGIVTEAYYPDPIDPRKHLCTMHAFLYEVGYVTAYPNYSEGTVCEKCHSHLGTIYSVFNSKGKTINICNSCMSSIITGSRVSIWDKAYDFAEKAAEFVIPYEETKDFANYHSTSKDQEVSSEVSE